MTDHADEAIREAQRLVGLAPLFLDTETTGLEYGSQVVEVGIVDLAGRVVFQSLVRPSVEIEAGAWQVHGICEHMLTLAPGWAQVQPRLLESIGDRPVCIYNVTFDLGMLATSATAANLQWPGLPYATCVMELVARWWGEWSEYHGNYRWLKLEDAVYRLGLKIKPKHRAVSDADACRQVLLALASEPMGMAS